MSTQTENMLERIRVRAAKLENEAQARLDSILERPKQKTKNYPKSPDWIEDSPVADVGKPKKSILDMMHGEVSTKASTQRGE